MGKTIIITGASDGIGAAAARALAQRGHRVVVVGRNPARTAAVAGEIGAPHHLADFASLADVRRLARELRERYPVIDVLANNAGGIMGERAVTTDGFEKTFQVNHLAPFLLTRELLPQLLAGRARVIQTASAAARHFSRFDIDDLQNADGYTPRRAYGNGKLENILFTEELQRRHGADGLTAVSFHPGVVGTSFAADSPGILRSLYHGPLAKLFTISPERGADQLIWLSDAEDDAFVPGAYYESRRIATRVAPQVGDERLARELWERSERMLAR